MLNKKKNEKKEKIKKKNRRKQKKKKLRLNTIVCMQCYSLPDGDAPLAATINQES